MKETTLPRTIAYARPGKLDEILAERLGTEASKAARCRFLNIGYSTYWRLRTQPHYAPSNEVIGAVLAALPNVSFDDLFETRAQS